MSNRRLISVLPLAALAIGFALGPSRASGPASPLGLPARTGIGSIHSVESR